LIWVAAGAVGGGILLLLLANAYFTWYIGWENAQRKGLSYYGGTLAERRAFREKIRRRSAFLLPFVRFQARMQAASKKAAEIPSFLYEGVHGPGYSASPESFRAAVLYRPTEQDLFVATQMKCGTTWMQQVAYEVLRHGEGDLSDAGHRHLNALSPWIEATDGVPLGEAPRVGARGQRIVKTHLPAKLCPYGEGARYLYVTRHPVSCFASVADYFQLMYGPYAPDPAKLLDWFLSERMWWLPWPEHVAGWWEWSQRRSNVLFVHFEEMKKDLAGVVRKVAEFLGERLSDAELKRVAEKSSFDYMRKNEELFEMSPPNLFSVSGTYFKSGQADRYKDVPEQDRKRILAHCKERLAGASYPAARFYPDLG